MKTRVYRSIQSKLLATIFCLSLVVPYHLLAQTWTQVNAPNTNWNSVVCSANGQTLACTLWEPPARAPWPGLIYVSTNSGATWATCNVGAPLAGNLVWNYLTISADGSKLLAVSNNYEGYNVALYSSTNTGASWNPILLVPKLYPGEQMGPIACSADATRLFVSDLNSSGSSSFIYASTNSGQTWTTNISPSPSGLTSMVCSADGHEIIANFDFNFYLSTNFGGSWTNISRAAHQTEVRYVGSASADGSIWTIKGDVGVLISTNFGFTWSLNYYNGNPSGANNISSSADGKTLFVPRGGVGGIYFSTNTGTTWQYFTNSGSQSYIVASSADGCECVASAANSIYLFQSTPSPTLYALPSATNLTLSWTVPSTNLNVQQSSDLVNWNDVTNVPTLNPSNLQNQISVFPTNNNCFFRLSTE